MDNSPRPIIRDPAAWIGPEIQNDRSWIYHIDAGAVEDVLRVM
jgi:hypothetical protein